MDSWLYSLVEIRYILEVSLPQSYISCIEQAVHKSYEYAQGILGKLANHEQLTKFPI